MSRNLRSSVTQAKRQTTILIGIAALLLLVGGVSIYVLEVRQARADADVARKQSEVGTSEEIARRYQGTLDNYNAAMEQLKFVEPSMTQDAYVPTLIQQLTRMAAMDHLKLTSVRPGTPADPPPPAKPANSGSGGDASDAKKDAPSPYKLMPVSIGLEGTYAQIMTYVFHLTKFPKIVMLQGMTLSPKTANALPGEGGKEQLVVADIGLQAYLFDDASDAAPADPAASVAADSGNPIAMAARKVADVARLDDKLSQVHERTQGLMDPSASRIHSLKGGLGSEQAGIR